jgi:hypothetical protein
MLTEVFAADGAAVGPERITYVDGCKLVAGGLGINWIDEGCQPSIVLTFAIHHDTVD